MDAHVVCQPLIDSMLYMFLAESEVFNSGISGF